MKSSFAVCCLVVWLISLIGAFYFGRASADADADELNSIESAGGGASARMPAASVDDASHQADNDPDGTTNMLPNQSMAASLDTAALTLADALQQVDRLTPAQTSVFLEEALALPTADPRRSALLTALLTRLAESAPHLAYEMTEQMGSLRDAERAKVAILEVWAERDPESALRWAKTALLREPQSLQGAQMRAILRG